jgi:hypothetical protein
MELTALIQSLSQEDVDVSDPLSATAIHDEDCGDIVGGLQRPRLHPATRGINTSKVHDVLLPRHPSLHPLGTSIPNY